MSSRKRVQTLVSPQSHFHLVALFTLFVFTLVAYWPLVTHIRTHTFGHDLAMNWVYFDFIKKSLQQYGQFPLWMPGLFSGFPLDTSNLAALFYPPHWLMIILPLAGGINFLTLVHIFMIGVSAYLLSYYGFHMSRAAALVAALSIMLSPKLLNHNYLGHINLIESIPWLILSLLFFIKSLERKSNYYALCLGFSLAMIMVVFSIFYIYAVLTLGLYFVTVHLFPFTRLSIKKSFRSVVYPIVGFSSSLLFGAVFLLPFLQFSQLSLRTRLTFWEGAFPALFWDNLIQLFYLFPHRFHDSETLIYVGIPTLLLALTALLFKFRNRKILFLFLLVIFSITVALGANAIFYKIYYRLLPFFHFMRAPLRIWILFIIGTGILAGIGADYLFQKYPRQRTSLLISFLLIIFISLQIYNDDYLKLTAYSESKDQLSSLAQDKSARIYCLNNCLTTADGQLRDWQFASGGEVVLLSHYYDFMKIAGGYQFAGYSLSIPPYQVFAPEGIHFEKQSPNPTLLGLTHSRYVISPYSLDHPDLKLLKKENDLFVYENQKVLPRLFTVPSATPFTSMEKLTELDFKKEVALKGIDQPVSHLGSYQEQKITYSSPNKLIAQVKTDFDGYLVLSDTYFPGWEATVDGQAVPILQANGAFRAIPTTAGTHQVVFEYFPLSLKIGAIVSLLALGSFGYYSLNIYRSRLRK